MIQDNKTLKVISSLYLHYKKQHESEYPPIILFELIFMGFNLHSPRKLPKNDYDQRTIKNKSQFDLKV